MKLHVTLLLSLAVAVPAVAVGCNLVVDAGGYSVGAVDAAAPGDDGGQESGPVSCGQGLASDSTFDQLVQSCLLAVSCDPFFFNVPLSTCLTFDYLHSHTTFSCLTTATSCADYYKCQHNRLATVVECPNSGQSTSCTAAGLAVNCSGRATGTVADCPSFGGKCATANGVSACVIPGSCSQTDNLYHCSANNQAEYVCVSGQPFGSNCAPGTTCGANGADAGATCYFNAPSCGTPSVGQCNGAIAEYCTSGKQLFTFDCSPTGSTCALDEAGTYYCLSPGCAVADFKQCSESCSSDKKTLNTCIGGASYAIDCTKYGTFTGCVQSTDTAVKPNRTYTYCN